MEIKLLEILDSGTFIPCIAISVSRWDGYLARRSGYGAQCILFGRLSGDKMTYDPYHWDEGSRTMPQAHHYIIENWDNLANEEVIDVEFILGETTEKKKSERDFFRN